MTATGLDAAEQRALLARMGAEAAVAEELAAYLDNPYRELAGRLDELPLAEEPQVPFWRRYAAEASGIGVAEALGRRFPQLLFPIAEGLADDPEYRAATRRGAWQREGSAGVGLERPGSLELRLDPGPAGPVPVLVARHRPDFVRLVQALTCRNRPEPVPPAMGACLVKGLADWERVAAYREAWEAERGGPASDAEWATEMASGLAPRKQLWQDRLILLSDGPYSAVPAEEIGLDEEGWRERSLALRLAHESFHYLTLRMVGTIRSHLLDELLADYAGLVAAFGRYDAGLALRFLGLDRLPEIRPEGRLAVYRGSLSDGAVGVLARLVAAAAGRLAELAPDTGRDATRSARRLARLAACGLDGLAERRFPERPEAGG